VTAVKNHTAVTRIYPNSSTAWINHIVLHIYSSMGRIFDSCDVS